MCEIVRENNNSYPVKLFDNGCNKASALLKWQIMRVKANMYVLIRTVHTLVQTHFFTFSPGMDYSSSASWKKHPNQVELPLPVQARYVTESFLK